MSLQPNQTPSGQNPSVKQYVAFMNTTEAVSAPSAIILQNTYGETLTWSYNGTPKSYELTSSGLFTENKTIIRPTGSSSVQIMGIGYTLPFSHAYGWSWLNSNTIRFEVWDSATFTNQDPFDILSSNGNLLVEILTFN